MLAGSLSKYSIAVPTGVDASVMVSVIVQRHGDCDALFTYARFLKSTEMFEISQETLYAARCHLADIRDDVRFESLPRLH